MKIMTVSDDILQKIFERLDFQGKALENQEKLLEIQGKSIHSLETKIEVINTRLNAMDTRNSDTLTFMGWGFTIIAVLVTFAPVIWNYINKMSENSSRKEIRNIIREELKTQIENSTL